VRGTFEVLGGVMGMQGEAISPSGTPSFRQIGTKQTGKLFTAADKHRERGGGEGNGNGGGRGGVQRLNEELNTSARVGATSNIGKTTMNPSIPSKLPINTQTLSGANGRKEKNAFGGRTHRFSTEENPQPGPGYYHKATSYVRDSGSVSARG
jgi:hypothetical protein